MAKAVLKKEDKQTVYRLKADKKGVIRRSSFWKDRSKLLRDIGTNIHGGEEGYELDIRYQVARNQTTIDAFLRIDKVQERSAVIAICFLYLSISSNSNTHYTVQLRLNTIVERDFKAAERTIEAAVISYIAKRRIRIGRKKGDDLNRMTTKKYSPELEGREQKSFSFFFFFFLV